MQAMAQPTWSRRWLTPAAALLLVTLAAGAAEVDEAASEALLARIAAAHQTIATVQGHLTWRTRRTDEPAASARVQQVQFFLQFPDHYCAIVTKPGDDDWKQSVLSDGTKRWETERMFQGDRPTVKSRPAVHDDADLLSRVVDCFRMNLPALRRDFTVAAAKAADGAESIVTLVPSHPPITEQLANLAIHLDASLRVERIVMEDPQGNHIEFAIDSAEYDKPISPALFHPPE